MRPHNMLSLLFLAALLLMVLGNKTHPQYKISAAGAAIKCSEAANTRSPSIVNFVDEQPLFFIPVYHKYF